jgi:hypothetical protein
MEMNPKQKVTPSSLQEALMAEARFTIERFDNFLNSADEESQAN